MVVIGGMDQLCHLILQTRHQFGMVVPQRVDGNPAQCVQIFTPIHVPDAAALTMRQGNRQATIGVHNVGRRRRSRQGGHSGHIFASKVV